VIGENSASFTHGDVMRWVKAECSYVSKGAHHLATEGATQGVTAIFYQP
jgi:hypothetical protein